MFTWAKLGESRTANAGAAAITAAATAAAAAAAAADSDQDQDQLADSTAEDTPLVKVTTVAP